MASTNLLASLQTDKSSPILVTGATGYVAGVLIKQLLDLGVTVHATVRNPTDTARLQYLQDLADKPLGSLKFFKGDLQEEGSFADGMAGCSVVFHTASPFILKVTNPLEDLVKPAVNGTRNVLNEATRAGTVKRVILTSSVVAIYNDPSDANKSPDNKLTEELWNTGSTLEYNPYFLSKTKAEMLAWEIAGSQTSWSMVAINPGMVMGPGVKYHETSESYALMKGLGGGAFANGCPNTSLGVVDVREVATAHIVAAYSNKAKGRYILVGANTGFKEMVEVTRQKFPEYPFPKRIISRFTFWLLAPFLGISRRRAWATTDVPINFDNAKSIKDLGITYRPLSETMQDMFSQLVDEGVVQKRK